MPQISTELDQLSIALIQTAIDMLDVHDDVPVMLAVDCDGELLTFEDDTPDGCYRAAREQVRSYGKDCVRYALLTQGFVQEDETDSGQPALLFEFAERRLERFHAVSPRRRWPCRGKRPHASRRGRAPLRIMRRPVPPFPQ